MRRFLVFAWPEFYPGGGWSDFVDSFDCEKGAVECADSKLKFNNGGVEVIDLHSGKDVYVYPQHRPVA